MQNIKPLVKTKPIRWRFHFDINMKVSKLLRDPSRFTNEHSLEVSHPGLTCIVWAPTELEAARMINERLAEVILILKENPANDD